MTEHLGEIAGITTALLWAVGGLLFATAGRRIGSNAVNEIRIVLALVVLTLTHAVLRGVPVPPGLRGEQWAWLLLSGVAGLALGDLFYFQCIVILGPRLGALLMALAPAMTVGLAWHFLGEALGPLTLLGITITTLGIAAVLADRRGRREWEGGHSDGWKKVAVAFGLLAALGQAVGNVLSKLGGVGVGAGANPIDPLSAVVVRMIGGAAGILVIAVAGRHVRRTLSALRDRRAMLLVCIAVVIGPTAGVWLYQVALHETDAAVAAILVSLVPIFLIPIARFAYGARPSLLGIAGTAVAVGGTVLLFLR